MVTNHTKEHQKFISYKPCTQKSKFNDNNEIIFGARKYITLSSKINIKTFYKIKKVHSSTTNSTCNKNKSNSAPYGENLKVSLGNRCWNHQPL